MYIPKKITFSIVLMLLSIFLTITSQAAKTLTLVENGKAQCQIVLALKPTKAAQLAAFELQEHIKLITGANIKIVTGDVSDAKIKLFVGNSASAKAAGMPSDFKKQQYAVIFKDNAILFGGLDKKDYGKIEYRGGMYSFNEWPSFYEPQGTMKAVYYFLENSCGIRWWDATEFGTDIPQNKTLTIEAKSIRRSPAFAYRDLGARHFRGSQMYAESTILWKSNSKESIEWNKLAFPELYKKYTEKTPRTIAKRRLMRLFLFRKGVGGCEAYVSNHTFGGYFDRFWKKNPRNPKAFEGSHPLWFAQGYPKLKRPKQMCYTNRGMIRQLAKDAENFFAGNGIKKRFTTARGDFFSIVPMDVTSFCKCDKCIKWWGIKQKESTFFSNGKYSNYMWQLYNRAAKILAKTNPDKYFSVLAYWGYSYYPTKVVPAKNISIQLCLHIRHNYDTLLQQNDMKIINQWTSPKEKNRRKYLWLYYCFPLDTVTGQKWKVFPGFFSHTISKRFKLYKQKGFRGAFFNGWCNMIDAYVTFKMLDNPNANVDKILDEFFNGYFGAAAKPIKEFYLSVEKIYADPANYPKKKNGTIGHQTENIACSYLGTKKRLLKLQALMKQAHSLAKSKIEKKRVELFDKGIWQYMKSGGSFEAIAIEGMDFKGLNGKLEKIYGGGSELLKTNALSEKSFEIDTEGAYFRHSKSRKSLHKTTAYTNGELDTIFVQHPKKQPVSISCSLGAVPKEGRQLDELKVIWSMFDPQRSRVAIQFFVRDAKSKKFRAITKVLEYKKFAKSAKGHYILTLTFPKGAVTNFDAIRMVDMARSKQIITTRFCEIEAKISPEK